MSQLLKRLITVNVILFVFKLSVFGQQIQPKTHLDSLYVTYPLKPNSKWPEFLEWDNPYFKAIIDPKLRQSVVTYGVFTVQEDAMVTNLKIPRKGKYARWHPFFGYPNEDAFYKDINKTLVKPDEYSKGHYSGWELNAYAVNGVLLSDTYDFNEGIERQAQNEGTELQVEYLTRALVGNKMFAKRVRYIGPSFPQVQYWKGSWGSFKLFNVDGISKNYSAVYWNLIKYGNELHAYWFPNDLTATAKLGYQHFEIPVDSSDVNNKGLIQRLGFDPQQVLN
ncbi:hypothetical protein [Mucilaginibacter sp.]|jgi:hypothetical protein|uniref:hypothetical protein n=1 Tax=Mucilaginibacter sp. TaxID=1882438 RepID=UPI002BE6952D|nr:hypothetical protein [Mucilaginibacter sp.]HTI60387.1 hypothetical protein [Mucilaginibacter sp.]